jgi:tetratricopeptide (TPR) repeat protein
MAATKPLQSAEAGTGNAQGSLDQISSKVKPVAPAIRLATMSAQVTHTDTLIGDSPLIAQLKAVDDSANTDASNGIQSRALARWQSVLQATSSSSIFGDDPAQLLSMQSLQEIQAAGLLSNMRQELELWQEQDPNNIGVRRMLAALYSVAGEANQALDERRKAASLPTAIGEDWFQLGLSEESAGNLNAANTDYSKAQQCGDLSNPMHINFVRQRLPQTDS